MFLIYKKTLGEENPETISVMEDLAKCLRSAAQYEKALKLDENVGEAEAYDALWQQELESLFTLISAHPETHWFIVSNEVGMGVVPAYKLGRTYRDMLGRANQAAAARAAEVIFMIAGIPLIIK